MWSTGGIYFILYFSVPPSEYRMTDTPVCQKGSFPVCEFVYLIPYLSHEHSAEVFGIEQVDEDLPYVWDS